MSHSHPLYPDSHELQISKLLQWTLVACSNVSDTSPRCKVHAFTFKPLMRSIKPKNSNRRADHNFLHSYWDAIPKHVRDRVAEEPKKQHEDAEAVLHALIPAQNKDLDDFIKALKDYTAARAASGKAGAESDRAEWEAAGDELYEASVEVLKDAGVWKDG